MKRLYHFESEVAQTKTNEDTSFNRDISDDKKKDDNDEESQINDEPSLITNLID